MNRTLVSYYPPCLWYLNWYMSGRNEENGDEIGPLLADG
jgi:hypothetical protein